MNPGPASIRIQFQPVGKRVSLSAGATVMDAARAAGIELASACGGEGSCGQCRVAILAGAVSPLTDDETFLLTPAEQLAGTRLACCTRALSDLTVTIPSESLITAPRLQIENRLGTLPPEPTIHAFPLTLAPPTLNDARPDFARVAQALASQHNHADLHAGLPLLRRLSPDLRRLGWQVSALVRGGELIGLLAPDQAVLGLAVDLGTTKIAALLVDLTTGQDVAQATAPNPQIGYGEDVISRLNYTVKHPDGAAILASLVWTTLNNLLGDMLAAVGAERDQVASACIVGNTAMTHLLLQFPSLQLGRAPFVAVSHDPLELPAADLGLQLAPGAQVYIPPGIGGFVGSDHVAMLLACDLDRSDAISLAVDIGTNTEVSLYEPGAGRRSAASCASGPAFEGAHIRDGMRAAAGAIEKVRFEGERVLFATVGEAAPVGICGSGILDAVAELYRHGDLNRWGRFQSPRTAAKQMELVPAAASGSGHAISLTQNDVQEILLAKGAIQAGLSILLDAHGLAAEAVEELVIAGAFGSYINVDNAFALGLFPALPNARVRQVGNAAALGAKWLLISASARQRAAAIAATTQAHELTRAPDFSRRLALAMLFPSPDNPKL